MSKRSQRKILANGMDGAKLVIQGRTPEIHASDQEDRKATFSMLLYNGGPIRPGGWDKPHPLVLDLAGMTAIRGGSIPFNRGHKGDSALVGHGTANISVDSVRINDGVFSFDNEHTRSIIESAKSGFVWASSMEATLLGTPKFVPAGKRVQINGRQIAGPVYVAKRSELFAGAFIGSNPADRTTSVSIAANLEDTKMNEKLKAWLESRDIDCESLTDEQITAWQSDYDALHADLGDPIVEAKGDDGASLGDDLVAEIRGKAAAEHARIDMVNKHCGTGYPEIRAKAIAKGWGEAEVELAVVKAKHAELQADIEGTPSGPAIHSSNSAEMQDTNVYAAALHQAMDSSIRDSDFVAEVYGEKSVELAKKLPKNAGLQYLCYAAIRAAGGYVEPGVGMSNDIWQRAVKADRILRAQSDIHAASAFSTFSLNDTLSNIAHKSLLRMYMDWPSLVNRICSTAEHTDFKEHTKIAVEGDLETMLLPPTGEIKHGTLSDTTYTNQIYTYARMLSVTRPDFFNDDLGAFQRNGRELGRGAMRAREKMMWLTILNPALTGPFWKDSAAATAIGDVENRLTATALGGPGLEAAELLMKQMGDEKGEPVMITPDAVLTGTVLAKTAENLLVRRTTTTADTNPSAGTPATGLRIEDSWLGRFGHIDTPYMDARLSIPGSSDSLWFLLGNKDFPAFEYAQLRGEGSPNIDSSDTDFNTLGFQSRIYWDYGFKEQNPRGMIRVEA